MAFCSSVFCNDNIMGEIIWTQKGPVVYARGIKIINPQMPMAVQRPAVIESAKISAILNVLELVKNVNIDSDNTIEKSSLYSSDRRKMIDLITKYKMKKPVFHNDGRVEVIVEVALYENQKFIDAILNIEKEKKVSLKSKKNDAKKYSGIIIDCRGYDIYPSLTINLLSEDKQKIYSSKNLKNQEIYKMGGMCQFVKLVEDAKNMTEVIGKNPLIIETKKTEGSSDIVINDTDIEVILGNGNNIKLLNSCKIVVVTNNM